MDDYLGFREASWSNDELSAFYRDRSANSVGCLINEYLIIKNDAEEVVDQYRWDGAAFSRVPFKQINSRFCGRVKPRNIQQQLAIDLLYNQDITVKILAGKFGTGEIFAPLHGNV